MSEKNKKASMLPSNTLKYPMRLDLALLKQGHAFSRSKGEELVRRGLVTVNNVMAEKPSVQVNERDIIKVKSNFQYVSRAAEKLASIHKDLRINFESKTVLDVGSSTGGFTQYAIRHGAKKVIAVDVGTNQLHPTLLGNPKIELHEKTDIREFKTKQSIDIVLADVSFISLRYILPAVSKIVTKNTQLIIMCKPQFEAGKDQINKGVIKNSKIRRQILHDFETWLETNKFIILDKADSKVAGAKGNIERFYKLRLI